MTDKYTAGLIVKNHKTNRTKDKEPVFKVKMESLDKKIKIDLELPSLGKLVFSKYPIGEVVEIELKDPSQETLETFFQKEEDNDD